MSDVSDFLEDEVNKQVRADTLNVLKGLVLSTPRLTGRAKGNWQVSISTPITTTIERLDKAGGSTINSGLNQINQAQQIKYPTMWITNNLPYIVKLNNGHSKQAPAKFVETAIKRATNG